MSVIRLENVKMYFPQAVGFKRKDLKAVDGVSFEVKEGQTVGLVGESGCGKSTLGKTICGLYKNTAGKIFFHDNDISKLTGEEKIKYRKNVQMVFQDPAASLNPRLKVKNIIAEPLLYHTNIPKEDREGLIKEIIKTVGLQEDAYNKYPHEFSGGQQQRIGIARALITKPEFIVCDEAVSALDVSVQAQILNLLQEMKEKYNLTYLFISHNLSVIKHMCNEIAVMYLGKIVEYGSKEQIFNNPVHPYTKALISAIPKPGLEHRNDQRIMLKGELPSPLDIPEGCPFHTRCIECVEGCDKVVPELVEVEKGHYVYCISVKQ